MREIKFRAWDEKRKQMEKLVYQIEWCNGGIRAAGPGVNLGEDGWVTQDNGFKHKCDVLLMQYTGLKDKNGVEIYEGDIVQRKNWHEDSDGKTVLSEANSYMKKWVVTYEIGSIWQGYTVDSKDEVIGNIYENPELLTT